MAAGARRALSPPYEGNGGKWRAVMAIDAANSVRRRSVARSARLRRLPIAAMAIGGGLLVSLGAFLPWLSLFAGLRTLAGTSGPNGWLLVAGGTVSVVAGAWFLVRGGGAARWTIGLLGLALLGFCGWLLLQLLDIYRRLSADAFVFSQIRPGLFVATGGAVIIAASLLAGEPSAPRAHDGAGTTKPFALAPVLAGLSAGAGVIHFAVIGSHAHESIVLAIAFFAAGLAQLLWAWLFLVAFGRWIALSGAALSALYVAVWAVSRTAGLPLGDSPWRAEPVGVADLITVTFETLTVLGALTVWRWPQRRLRLARPAAGVVCVLVGAAIAAPTFLAALDGSGAAHLLRR